jgi:acetyltransferase-like isoleucine patch superfamily enzyme
MSNARAMLRKSASDLLARTRAALAERPLRRSAVVADPLYVTAAPHIENAGRLEIGPGFSIVSSPVQAHIVVQRGATLLIGRGVSMAHGTGIACHSHIQIGDCTQIGAFTMLLDTDYHVPGNPTARAEPLPISIGHGVRIGSQVTILRGSRIGDGALIEAGTVVSGEIPAGARVAGVPARLVQEAAPLDPGASLETRVAHVAMKAFRLQGPPSLSDGPAQISAWDSLGALSFLIGLEEEFGLTLGEKDAQSVRRLSDVVHLLGRRERAA